MQKRVKNTDELLNYQNNYSERKLWSKLKSAASQIGRTTVYYILVLHYVLNSPNVSLKNKGIICGALGYLILPIDLIPDAIPVLGFTDDAAAIKMAYDTVRLSITPEIEAKANAKVDDWFKTA